ncbi:MAG: hypothetical protein U1A23_03720 [Candidatus Sungbacteria bacterium]|nr:hypothetical protein [Candidatus Sungbacteria bacterium]
MSRVILKKMLIAIVLIAVVFFAALSINSYKSFFKGNEGDYVKKMPILNGLSQDQVRSSEVQNKNSLKNNEKEIWSPMGSAADTAEIKNWFAQRGNFSFMGDEKLNDYATYDDATLNQLGDAGDLRALHTLADRSKNINDFKSTLYKASVWGSTEALIRMGAISEADDLDSMSAESRKQMIIDALSYYDAAQLRGDWWGNIVRGESLLKRYSHDLSQYDKSAIQSNAKKIYADIQRERNALGLGEFDNSIPESVIKFYEEMIRPL